MTVNTAASKISYLGDGSTTQWTFPFPAVDASFIEVSIVDSQGTITNIAPAFFSVTLDPTVDPNPTSQGGFVIYPLTGPPLATGNEITIVRNLPAVQSVSLSNQSIVYPPVIEQEFDYLTLLQGGGAEEFSRAFRVGPQDPVPAVVPPVAQRANHAAFFDGFGNLTPGSIPAPSVFISAAMTPVVEAVTLPLARDAMGVTQAIQDAVNAAVNALLTTGDLKPTHKTVADAGWIMWVDGTIGGAGSGSSIRSNADTQALFTLYYNSYSDTDCPLKTGAGAATTRAAQGTAAAAFTANCRMTMPKGAGRSLSIAGSGVGLTNRVLGSSAGAELESPTIAKTASHNHQLGSGGDFVVLPQGPAPTLWQTLANTGASLVNAYLDVIGYIGGSVPLNILSPSTYVNVMVKL
jgi:hypothetical protein